MRGLFLAGGTFNGAFQVPVIEHLLNEHHYDVIFGVSAGAMNGVLAAQRDMEHLYELWEGIDDSTVWGGIRGYLRPQLFRNGGYFSTKPLARLLDTYVDLDKIQIPFGCGLTIRKTKEFRIILSSEAPSSVYLRKAVLGSAAQAGIMNPVTLRIDGEIQTVHDGGHRHNFCPPPDYLTHIDVVLCNPMSFSKDERKISFLTSTAWAVETGLETNLLNDIEYLRLFSQIGKKKIRIFAPDVVLGSMFDATQVTIQKRLKAGRLAVDKPVFL